MYEVIYILGGDAGKETQSESSIGDVMEEELSDDPCKDSMMPG